MLSRLFDVIPPRKEQAFDVEAHVNKEKFLREQLLLEKKQSKEIVEKYEQQAKDIKSQARLVVGGLMERIRILEAETEKYRSSDAGALKTIDTDNQVESTVVCIEQVVPTSPVREALLKEAVESDSPYEIPSDVFNSLQNTHPELPSTKMESHSVVQTMVSQIESKHRFPSSSRRSSFVLSGDDDNCLENAPLSRRNSLTVGTSPKISKKAAKASRIPSSKSFKSKKHFFPEDEDVSFEYLSELETMQQPYSLEADLRTKDEIIARLQEELQQAKNREADLNAEIHQLKREATTTTNRNDTIKSIESDTESAVKLNNQRLLVYEDQVFANNALVLLFLCMLGGLHEVSNVPAEEERTPEHQPLQGALFLSDIHPVSAGVPAASAFELNQSLSLSPDENQPLDLEDLTCSVLETVPIACTEPRAEGTTPVISDELCIAASCIYMLSLFGKYAEPTMKASSTTELQVLGDDDCDDIMQSLATDILRVDSDVPAFNSTKVLSIPTLPVEQFVQLYQQQSKESIDSTNKIPQSSCSDMNTGDIDFIIDEQRKRINTLQIVNELHRKVIDRAFHKEEDLSNTIVALRRCLAIEAAGSHRRRSEDCIHKLQSELRELVVEHDAAQHNLAEQQSTIRDMQQQLQKQRVKVAVSSSVDQEVMTEILSCVDVATETEGLVEADTTDTTVKASTVSEEEVIKLKESLQSMKKTMKERTMQSIEKIKALQSEMLTMQQQKEQLTVDLQALEAKNFESQVELQEAKQKLKGMVSDKKKTKDHYRHQMKEYQKRYDDKCREIERLQTALTHDKERFQKLKQSMKRIANLKSVLFDCGLDDSLLNTSQSTLAQDEVDAARSEHHNPAQDAEQSFASSSLNSSSLQGSRGHLHADSELHRLYMEEIQRHLESKEHEVDEQLRSELDKIQSDLAATLQGIPSAETMSLDEQESILKADASSLFTRILCLQQDLEAKHEECSLLHEEVISLRSQLHLYEIFGSRGYSSSPVFDTSSSAPEEAAIGTSTPGSHAAGMGNSQKLTPASSKAQRQSEINGVLRMKIYDLQTKLLALQQEKEDLKVMHNLASSSAAREESNQWKRLQEELEQTLSALQQAKSNSAEWQKKYEMSRRYIEDVHSQSEYFRQELELERVQTLDLLSQIGSSAAPGSNITQSESKMLKNILAESLEAKKALRRCLFQLVTSDKMENIEESITGICNTLQMLPQEADLFKGTIMKLGPMIVAYSSFEDSVLDINIAIDSLVQTTEDLGTYGQGFGYESY